VFGCVCENISAEVVFQKLVQGLGFAGFGLGVSRQIGDGNGPAKGGSHIVLGITVECLGQ